MTRVVRQLGMVVVILFLHGASALAQTWQPAPTAPFFANMTFLLTDGSVMVHQGNTSQWWRLTPDAFGDYAHGTWTPLPSMPAGYGPLYYASAVLPDGRLLAMGGEYNLGSGQVETNRGAIFDPTTNAWTPISAPANWQFIGDAPSAVLANGRLMLGNLFSSTNNAALFDAFSFSWTPVGTGKADSFVEEGLTLLPDGSLLAVDVIGAPHAERFIPSLDTWISAGNTPVNMQNQFEMGPSVLRPDGTVIVFGANGHNAVYTPGPGLTDPGSWASAPDFPVAVFGQLDVADGPACLLPSGNVLVGASPGVFFYGTQFFEFDGTLLNPVPGSPQSPFYSSYTGNMLMLPTGQVLYTDSSNDVEIYTPAGAPLDAWRPTISSWPASLSPGQTFVIAGTQFNGLSQASAYGDDSANATNYPLIRITNTATGHVSFARTFDHSTMAVATGSTPTSTNATVPLTIEAGPSTLEVVTNGIASFPVAVSIGAFDPNVPFIQTLSPTSVGPFGPGFVLTVNGLGFQAGDTVTWNVGSAKLPLATTFVSANQLAATVTSDLVAAQGSAFVQLSRADGTVSNVVGFVITTDIPFISAIAPNTAQAGGPDFTMSVSGVRFRNGDVVTWTQGTTATALTTTFGSASALTATVPASLIVNPGSASVTVVRANGRVSNPVTFTIVLKVPALTSLAPTTISGFDPPFVLTVDGSNFIAEDTLTWSLNGVTRSLATTIVSPTRLTAIIPTPQDADGGTATVTVQDARGHTSNTLLQTVTPTTPVLTSIAPPAVSAGSPSFTLTLNGSFFGASARVTLQTATGTRTQLPTVFVSSTTLTVLVPDTVLATPTTLQVWVTNMGVLDSGSLPVLVGDALILSSISPRSTDASAPFTMTLKGKGFLPGAQLLLTPLGAFVPTTVLSSTQMTADIPASAVRFAGTTNIQVVNPGGALSPGVVQLTVKNPSPTIASIDPSTIAAGSTGVMLTITGTGFVLSSGVSWDTTPLQTTYVSSTQLVALVPDTLVAAKGRFTVTVQNTGPGGGASNKVRVVVQ